MIQRILIVDDEHSIVTLLQYNIEKAGCDTAVAYSGTEAFDKAMNEAFDLIVLDLMLPGMEGTEVCKRLRQEKVDTPILMLTAKGDEFDKVIGLVLVADDYFTIHFLPKTVIARIIAYMRITYSIDGIDNLYCQIR